MPTDGKRNRFLDKGCNTIAIAPRPLIQPLQLHVFAESCLPTPPSTGLVVRHLLKGWNIRNHSGRSKDQALHVWIVEICGCPWLHETWWNQFLFHPGSLRMLFEMNLQLNPTATNQQTHVSTTNPCVPQSSANQVHRQTHLGSKQRQAGIAGWSKTGICSLCDETMCREQRWYKMRVINHKKATGFKYKTLIMIYVEFRTENARPRMLSNQFSTMLQNFGPWAGPPAAPMPSLPDTRLSENPTADAGSEPPKIGEKTMSHHQQLQLFNHCWSYYPPIVFTTRVLK